MGLVAVFAVLLQACLFLKSLHSSLGFAAELTVHLKRRAQLIQQFLQGFDIRARGALFQKAGAKGVSGDRFYGLLRPACIAVIDEGQLIPVCPGPLLHLGLDAPGIKALPFHGITVSDVIARMTSLVERHTGDLRQGVDGAPVHALALGPTEHAVGSLVRTAVGAVLAGDGFIRADGFQHTLTAVCPDVALTAPDAVGDHRIVSDVLLVFGHTTFGVMGRVLVFLPRQKTVGSLVDAGAVPVRLTHHLLAPGRKVLICERRIDSFRHRDFLRS